MDRDQRSRRQKSGADTAAHLQNRPKNRSLGNRMGLSKKGPAPKQPQAPPRAGQPPRKGQAAPQGRTPPPRRPQQNPQKPGYRPGAPQQKRRITRAEQLRMRRRRRVFGLLGAMALLGLGVVLSVNLLFKVTDFQLENIDRTTPADTGIYTEQQIIDLLEVQVGDNLFGFSTKEKAGILAQALPYLDEVQVRVRMPGSVIIRVRPANERFALQTADGWLVLSDALKVLRTATDCPEGLILLQAGLEPGQSTAPGSFLTLESTVEPAATPATAPEGDDAEPAAGSEPTPAPTATATPVAAAASAAPLQSTANEAVASLMDCLEDRGLLQDTTAVNVESLGEISFTYQGRIVVKLGTVYNMSYKVSLAAKPLLDTDGTGLTATDAGTLDVSYQRSDGDIWAYFEPQATPSPTPAPTPEPTPEPEA